MADWPERGEAPWDDKLKAYIDEAAASGAPNFFPRTRSGRWMMGMHGGLVTNQPPAPGFVPIQLFRDQSWNALGINVNTLVAGGLVHAALYADNGDGYPGDMIINAGSFDCSTTGVKELVFPEPLALPAGLYWTLGIPTSSSIRIPVTTHTGTNAPGSYFHAGPAGANSTTLAGGYHYSQGSTPPATAPTGMTTNRWLPIISMRAE